MPDSTSLAAYLSPIWPLPKSLHRCQARVGNRLEDYGGVSRALFRVLVVLKLCVVRIRKEEVAIARSAPECGTLFDVDDADLSGGQVAKRVGGCTEKRRSTEPRNSPGRLLQHVSTHAKQRGGNL
jgi:hypothetical protein